MTGGERYVKSCIGVFGTLSCIVSFGILLISVLWSGYFYQYDGDELLHAQKAFLITQGFRPFGDYLSIYTPLFHWLIAPTIRIFGTTLTSLHVMRVETIGLYLLLILISFTFLRAVYGKAVAVLFTGLVLLNPFITFAGMQVRPDTLMLTLFVIGLYAAAVALVTRRRWDWAAAGAMLSISCLTAIKILPAVAPVAVSITCWLWHRKDRGNLIVFLLAAVAPWVLFTAYFASLGLVVPMVTQLTVDIKYLSDAIQNPTHFGFFYLPNNIYIYGAMGKPLTWVYVWILPMLGAAGAYQHVLVHLRRSERPGQHVFAPITDALPLSMILAFLTLFIPTTVFIQYYVPVNWFFSVFAAMTLVGLWELVLPVHRPGLLLVGVSIYMLFAISAVGGNIRRAEISYKEIEQQLETMWQQLPEHEPVFQSYLYRPIVYPIGGYNMGDVPPVIRRQFVQPEIVLEQNAVRFLILNNAGLKTYDPTTVRYILSHYHRVEGNPNLMIRNE